MNNNKNKKKMLSLIFKGIKKYIADKINSFKSCYNNKKKYLEEYSAKKDFKDVKYNDLAPKDDIKKSEEYFKAIDWALENKEVYNAALTGPYGSGKSSILKSYEKSHLKYKYLNISLAAFDVDKNESEDINIEKGILQQLFYKVDSKRIPYTRFRKIINTKLSSIIKNMSLLFLNIFLGIIIFKPRVLLNVNKSAHELNLYIHNEFIISAVYIIFLLLIFYNVSQGIKYCKSRIKLSRLTIEKAEVELDKENTESIFNKYLDEILYFFETADYNVVVIEDLDRFNNTRIFTKLRELNLLINNYEKIKRRIVFIYAVKDDMFKNDERTKFFDFIIPVIPVINSVNAGEILDKMIYQDNLGKNIPKEFINGVSVYINDMRMLTNIYNEFRLYKSVLKDISLKPYKILALVIYKNLYPDDFALLQYNEGLVYKAFANKKEAINKIKDKLNQNIEELNNVLKNVDNEFLKSKRELKGAFLSYIANGEIQLRSICGYDINTFFSDDFDINKILSNEVINYEYYQNGYGRYNGQISIDEINEKCSNGENFKVRFDNLKYQNKEERAELVKKIDALKEKLQLINTWNLENIIKEYGAGNVLSPDILKEKPIVYLLRHGYIDETYENYLTYFYGNTVIAQDMNFILGVRNYEGLPFDYELTKLDGVICKLNEEEFSQKEILNFSLLKYILNNKTKYKKQLKKIIKLLSNEEEYSIDFIDEFRKIIHNESCEKEFWQEICSSWHGIWVYINNKADYSDYKKDGYLFKIFKYVNIDTIEELNIDNNLADYIADNEKFMISASKMEITKIKTIIERLDIKFNVIEIENVNNELLNFIWDECRYSFNEKIICDILNVKCNMPFKLINEKNFTAVITSKYDKLIEYVHENISEYIRDVFIKMSNNIYEDKENIIKLLNWNSDELSNDLKAEIINKEDFVLSKLEKIPNELWKDILNGEKITVEWNNVISYYKYIGQLNDVLIDYLNKETVYTILSKDTYEEDDTAKALIKI